MSHMDGIYEPHWQIGLAPLPIGKCPMGKTKRPMTKNHVPHEEIKTPHGFCGDTLCRREDWQSALISLLKVYELYGYSLMKVYSRL